MKDEKWYCEVQAPPELHKPIQELFDTISWKLKHAESSSAQFATDINVGDKISRQAAMVVFENSGLDDDSKDTAVRVLEQLPPAQPEYEPVTAEDFAKTMSENTIWQFAVWHGHALELMKEQGFIICKKAM